jgi:DNA polymerase III alpha subunit
MKYITKCGSEVSVASTKAFTSQLVVLYILANVLANKTDDLLGDLPQAIENTVHLAQRCHFMAHPNPAMLPNFSHQNINEVDTDYSHMGERQVVYNHST